jgi:phosphatidylglycerophosphate synthase
MVTLDAILIADVAPIGKTLGGLTLTERARRVAVRAGARRVFVLDGASARERLPAWWADDARAEAVLILRAGDQLVHAPLVAPLLEAVADGAEAAAAIAPAPALAGEPTDLAAGELAGAAIVVDAAAAAVQALADGGGLAEAIARAPAATRIAHGPIARHPVRTPAEHAAAERLLYRILVKPQDNAITRFLYRPVSLPITRVLVTTPITPNQISLLVAVIVGIGVWLTASASSTNVLLGSIVILLGSYLDCCDGEVARIKLMSSRFGAWFDTITDELSTIGYMLALGYHCSQYYGRGYLDAHGWPPGAPDPWLAACVVATAGYLVTVYGVYWNIIKLVGSANSQDYVGRYDVVPSDEPGVVRLRPAAAAAAVYTRKPLPTPVRQIVGFLPNMVRRDFISWAAVLLAALVFNHFAFGLQVVGAAVSGVVVALDHVRVRRQLRAIARAGQRLA